MEENKILYEDNEYFIMNEILDNENISQRKLSQKLGLSLGSVNLLINKMIKEGLIKMEHVSQKQVAYMLTPMGMVEKGKKTIRYLKGHYRVIYETKEKIKNILDELNLKYDKIVVVKSEDEIGEILGIAISEYRQKNKNSHLVMVEEKDQIEEYKKCENTVLIYGSLEDKLKEDVLDFDFDGEMVWLVDRL